MMDIVVSHYNEDINWTKNLPYKVFIYSKTIEDINNNIFKQQSNIGNEATSYLEYIIDNYNNLPEYIYFCHGHNESYHQDYSNEFIIKNIDLTKIEDFLNINNYYNYIDNLRTETILKFHSKTDNKPYRIIIDFFNEIGSKYKELPNFVNAYSCAQFFVTRNMILNNSIEFYKNCLDWFYSGNGLKLDSRYNAEPNVYSSRCFEWIWCYIFTNNKEEKIINLIDFFKK
jgi:hypothetical protein